jgi:hypothetical protein
MRTPWRVGGVRRGGWYNTSVNVVGELQPQICLFGSELHEIPNISFFFCPSQLLAIDLRFLSDIFSVLWIAMSSNSAGAAEIGLDRCLYIGALLTTLSGGSANQHAWKSTF